MKQPITNLPILLFLLLFCSITLFAQDDILQPTNEKTYTE